MQLTKLHLLVIRACMAHGENGNWDMDAVKRHLIECDGMTRGEAQAAIDTAERDGVIEIERPESAAVLPFSWRAV